MLDEIKCTTMLITPEFAGELLLKNIGNRNTRKTKIEEYSRTLKKNEWIYTHQGIAVSKSGILIDGQHRLMAVKETGIAAKMLVFTNVPDEAFEVIDQGEKRSPADVLRTSRTIASVVRLSCRIVYPSVAKPTYKDMLPFYEELNETLETIKKECPSTRRGFSKSTYMLCATISIMMNPDSRDYVLDTFGALIKNDIYKLSQVSRIACGWKKQHDEGTTGNKNNAQDPDSIARAMMVFNPKYKDNKYPIVTDNNIELWKNVVREFLQNLVEGHKVDFADEDDE